MVDLVRAGRDPADLAREFEPSAEAVRNWVMQADLAEGGREVKPTSAVAEGTLTVPERDELARLRRENRQLRLERLDPLCGSSLSKAAAWFARARPAARIEGTLPSGSSGS